MKHKLKKAGKILGIIIGSLLLFIVISTLIINFLFRDQLISFVINQLNKQIETTITVKKVDFSIWKKFPDASIEFVDIMVSNSRLYNLDKPKSKDTLLSAQKLFLDFNIFKLVTGSYQLDRIHLLNGKLKIATDNSGIANYDIFKKGNQKSKGDLNIDLEKVILEDTYIEYGNANSGIIIAGKVDKLKLKGKFKNTNFKLRIDGDLFMNTLSVNNENYLINKSCNVDLNLDVFDQRYIISSSYAIIEKSKFNVNGDFELRKLHQINLLITGDKLNVNRIIKLLPSNIQDNLKNYKRSGSASISVKIVGPLNIPGINPLLEALFSIQDGSFTEISTGMKLNNISFSGKLSNQRSNKKNIEILKISNFSAKLGTGLISGFLDINGFSYPLIHLGVKSKIDLNELKLFFKLDEIEIFNGFADCNLLIDGNLQREPKITLSNLSQLFYHGEISLLDVGVKLKNNDYSLSKIKGTIGIDNDIHFNDLEVYLHDNDFKLKGVLTNGVKYFFHGTDKNILLTAEVNSKNLDLSKYFVINTNSNTSKKSGYSRELLFPDDITLNVMLKVNNFKLHNFKAKWITGNLFYKPRMFTLKSLSFETMTGHASGNGVILQDLNKNFITKGQLDLNHIDIQQMFLAFNNFSQDILRSEHLKGNISGKTEFSTEWNNSLILNKDKLLVEGDININNGELINFEPLRGLSRFISIDELKNIKFANLKNRIVIKDKQVIIPQMDVYTSAFNIKASGIHNFDNHYIYKVNVLLSDILWRKAKRQKKQNEEFGIIEDDGVGKTTLPLSIIGYNSDFKITYDTKQAMINSKQKLGLQKTELKSIFHDEFGWYKKDSTLKTKGNNKAKTNIRVSWDDDNASTTAPELKEPIKSKQDKTPTKKNEKINVEWDN